LGDRAAGKTSLVRRFVYNQFDDKHSPSVGIVACRRTLSIALGGTIVDLTLVIWDVAGVDLAQLPFAYLTGAAGALLVCDLSHPEGLDQVVSYAERLREDSPGARLVVAGNKSDISDSRRVDPTRLGSIAASIGAPCYLTSARSGAGVAVAFQALGRMLAHGDEA
jgi:small GTP-binding protein